MKLLIQSDDYGMTKAQALGALEAIKNGIIKNTGMFMNMPIREECANLIKPYKDKISLGVDLNISTGYPLSNPEDIPSLVKGDRFLTSHEARQLDLEEDKDHVTYEDVYKECKAQIEEFIRIFNCKPDYIHYHAYYNETVHKAENDLANEYGIIYSMQYFVDNYYYRPQNYWYEEMDEFNQKDIDVVDYILKDHMKILNRENVWLVTHCGYIDAELYKLTSYHDIRCKDLEMVTSDKIKKWIKEHNIELITYKDIQK